MSKGPYDTPDHVPGWGADGGRWEASLPMGVAEPGGETTKEQVPLKVKNATKAEGDPTEVPSTPGPVCRGREWLPWEKAVQDAKAD